MEEAELRLKQAAERSDSNSPRILHLDLAHADDPHALTRVISGQEAIAGPQPSPDGKQLVYMSGRSEAMDIGVSNTDGAFSRRLTSLGKCGTPRWSPDSRWIAFDTDGRSGNSGIYVVVGEGVECC